MTETSTADDTRTVTGTPRARQLPAWVVDQGGLALALLVLYIVLAVIGPNFLTLGNQLNVLREAAFVGIIAFGMTLVIIGGEIDISVGSTVALTSALIGVLAVNNGLPLPVACAVAVAVGGVVGLGAGWVRARLGVPSFIVTLALYLALRGMGLLITNAFPVSIRSDAFNYLGSGYLFGVPVPALVMLVTFGVFLFVSRKTAFGRSVYAVGGNAEAARLSGIPVARVRMLLFATTGVLAALVGVLQSARLSSGNANIANGLEFDVIAAVIIGGASLSGGKGTMLGTFLGVLFITVLANGLVLLGVNPYAQQVARGAIVLLAVLLSTVRGRGVETSS